MPSTKAQDAERINALAERAFGLLSQLGSPVHCGHAFAIAQAKLMIESGLKTDKQVRTAMATMTREVLKHFKRMRSEENLLVGGLNRSTQHFILEGKDGVWDGTKIS
jgi:hypothetical protein